MWNDKFTKMVIVCCAVFTGQSINAHAPSESPNFLPALYLLLLNEDESICNTPPDFFVGDYLMEQLSGQDPLYASETFGDTQVVNIVADGHKRSFDFLYFPGIFDYDYNFTMTLSCGEIQVHGKINTGSSSCDFASIGFSTGIPVSTYDGFGIEDIIMLVNVSDFDPDGDCSTGPYQVELRFTKQM